MESVLIIKSEKISFKKEINIISDKNDEVKIVFESRFFNINKCYN